MTKPVLYTCAPFARPACYVGPQKEAGVDIDLKILPFPPRYLAPEFMEFEPARHGAAAGGRRRAADRELRDSALPCDAARLHPARHRAGGTRLRRISGLIPYHADATITFPQTVYMRFAIFEKDKGLAEAGHAYAKWFHKRLVKVEKRLESRGTICAGTALRLPISASAMR